jgi:hypothetical protein
MQRCIRIFLRAKGTGFVKPAMLLEVEVDVVVST